MFMIAAIISQKAVEKEIQKTKKFIISIYFKKKIYDF